MPLLNIEKSLSKIKKCDIYS